MIHGERDRTIPGSHGERLAAVAPDRTDLWVVPGAGHVGCHLRAGGEYRRRVIGFLRRHLPHPAPG